MWNVALTQAKTLKFGGSLAAKPKHAFPALYGNITWLSEQEMVLSLLEAAELVVAQWRSLIRIFKSIVTRDDDRIQQPSSERQQVSHVRGSWLSMMLDFCRAMSCLPYSPLPSALANVTLLQSLKDGQRTGSSECDGSAHHLRSPGSERSTIGVEWIAHHTILPVAQRKRNIRR